MISDTGSRVEAMEGAARPSAKGAALPLLTSPPTEVAAGVFGMRILMVNVYFVATPTGWVLIDAGLPHTGPFIKTAAKQIFGADASPEAIILTHAHFDHVGALKDLLAQWPETPVYAHVLERPFLTGQSKYAPPDPWVGGTMSLASMTYPRGPIDIGDRLHDLPTDRTVPHLDDWRWLHTPGHSPGHVSLFREQDRTLVAGDAFVTAKQETLIGVLTQAPGIFGPPAYFTHDWEEAAESLRSIIDLHPAVAATGHGRALAEDDLSPRIDDLLQHFRERAIPKGGRYSTEPAVYNESGLVSVPPGRTPPLRYIAGAILVGGAVAIAASSLLSERGSRRPHA
ncbi:MAG: MBL fold metallo-hydrolase [Tepidisphaeraceae bacterium]